MVTQPTPGSSFPGGVDPSRPVQPRQATVFRYYRELQSIAAERFSGSLAGRMVLSVSPGLEGAELVVAALIAGGAVLAMDRDSERLKAWVRAGSCDFMVNTLHEAIRILKNEVRKGTPVSVCLEGDVSHIFSEMEERGLQPDLIAGMADSGNSEADVCRSVLEPLIQRGAVMFDPSAFPNSKNGFDDVTWTAETPRDLRQMDTMALELVSASDRVRRTWLERAGGYFYREHPAHRDFAMEAGERVRLVAAFENARSSGVLQSEVSVTWQEPGAGRRTLTI